MPSKGCYAGAGMSEAVRWGVLGAARIALQKVIPAMQRSQLSEVKAIASRDRSRAEGAADELGIGKAYGSYEELLADPEIEAVYNPLPNHLHVPWTRRAAEAGKHVLCEKPIARTAAEAQELLAVRDSTGVQLAEAFMVRSHPQWLAAREIVRSGAIGRLRAIQAFFSYMNLDPANIRNRPDLGGGGLLDIGCYPVVGSRYLFGAEPSRVLALVENDPKFGTDRLVSAVLDFPEGQASFVCSTQLVPYQSVQAFGTEGRVEIEIPFNAPPDRPCRIFVDDGRALGAASARTVTFAVADQYTLQADRFSALIREGGQPDFPLEDAIQNMRVLDGLVESGRTSSWVAL